MSELAVLKNSNWSTNPGKIWGVEHPTEKRTCLFLWERTEWKWNQWSYMKFWGEGSNKGWKGYISNDLELLSEGVGYFLEKAGDWGKGQMNMRIEDLYSFLDFSKTLSLSPQCLAKFKYKDALKTWCLYLMWKCFFSSTSCYKTCASFSWRGIGIEKV